MRSAILPLAEVADNCIETKHTSRVLLDAGLVWLRALSSDDTALCSEPLNGRRRKRDRLKGWRKRHHKEAHTIARASHPSHHSRHGHGPLCGSSHHSQHRATSGGSSGVRDGNGRTARAASTSGREHCDAKDDSGNGKLSSTAREVCGVTPKCQGSSPH